MPRPAPSSPVIDDLLKKDSNGKFAELLADLAEHYEPGTICTAMDIFQTVAFGEAEGRQYASTEEHPYEGTPPVPDLDDVLIICLYTREGSEVIKGVVGVQIVMNPNLVPGGPGGVTIKKLYG
jgi:hypothetical protein